MTADFWHSNETLVLVNPHRPEDDTGVQDFVEQNLGKQGWLLFQTSGSESTPKWVVLSKSSMLISAEAVNAHLQTTAEDRWLIALPMHHVGGFAIHARAFASGARVDECSGKWSAQDFVKACQQHESTLSSLVPTQVFDLVNQGLKPPPSLRAIVIGGGALPNEIREQAIALGWPVLQSYGMTEACSQIATEPLSHLLGSSSHNNDELQVLPHWQTSTDAEQHLVLSGSALAHAYVRHLPDSTDFMLERITSLTTRDRVELWHKTGTPYLRFIGRSSQSLKINGELVQLQPLQAKLDALCLSFGVPCAAVLVPLPHARNGAKLVLAHDHNLLSDATTLLTAYNAMVMPLERVKEARAMHSIPRSSLGKILLTELQQCLGEP